MREIENPDFPFELLQDFQVKCSLLTVEDEKREVITLDENNSANLKGLERNEVALEPCALRLDENILQLIGFPKEQKLRTKLPVEFTRVDKFLKTTRAICGEEIVESEAYRLIRAAIDERNLATYWQAMKIIAFHSFKSRMILRIGSQFIPIKTKRQFEYHFKSRSDPESVGNSSLTSHREYDDNASHGDSEAEVSVCFDGSQEAEFETFFSYVLKRICGRMDRQIKLGVLAPLLVWHERFKDELIVFFKAKIGGNGYAKDYIDTKVRELQREQKELSSVSEAQLVQQSFAEALEREKLTNREYACLIALNRGYGFVAISRFTGFSIREVKSIVEVALPKAADIIFKAFCEKYNRSQSKEGLEMTEQILRRALLDSEN
jgi:hypothetical protein